MVLRLRVPRELAGEAQVDLGHLAAIARLNGAGGAGGAANGSQDSRGAAEAARDGDGRVTTLPAVRRGAGVGAEAASMGDAPAFEGGSLREALRQLQGLRVSAHGSHGSQEAAAHGAQDSGAATEAAEAVGSLRAAQPAPAPAAAGEARHGAADEEASAGDGAHAAAARGGAAGRRAGAGAAEAPPEMMCPITAQLMRDPASKSRRPLRRWRCC
jgi:hypothetical protein